LTVNLDGTAINEVKKRKHNIENYSLQSIILLLKGASTSRGLIERNKKATNVVQPQNLTVNLDARTIIEV